MIHTVLTLKNLPPPPPGKTGWPWTEQSEPLPERMPDGSKWPRISIVTPSYNQGDFIEETIRSVLLQGYPNLEYILIDGGSSDNSVDIIKKYGQYLAYWVIEADSGQSNALNKGFRKATGELIGWQNSDDYYHFNSLRCAAQAIKNYENVEVIYGSTDNVDSNGKFIRAYPVSSFDIYKLIPYLNMCNQSMFFSKKIFEQCNFIDESFKHGMDQEFLLRLAIKDYKFQFIPEMIGYYRVHENSKGTKQYDICLKDCLSIYKSIYLNTELPIKFREKSLQCIRSACLDSFGKMELDIFRESVRGLVSTAGWSSLSLELSYKYLLSLLGDNVKTLKQIKSGLKFDRHD